MKIGDKKEKLEGFPQAESKEEPTGRRKGGGEYLTENKKERKKERKGG